MQALNPISKRELPLVIKELNEKREKNRFLLSYIEKLEIERDYKLFRYGKTYILDIRNLIISLSYTEEPDRELKDVIGNIKSRMVIIPGEKTIEIFKDIEAEEKKVERLMVFKREGFKSEYEESILSSFKDYLALLDFYDEIDEYKGYYSPRDMAVKFRDRDKAHFASAIKVEGKIVSALFMNSALIASVGTLKEYRKKGYAERNIKSAIAYYFDSNKDEKSVYLFYNDEKIGELYRKMGFSDVSPFLIIKRKI